MKRFATQNEINAATTEVDVNAAIKLLQKNGGYKNLNEEQREELELLCPKGGPVIGATASGKLLTLDIGSHILSLAATGRGKTRRELMPTLTTLILNGKGNFIINDMKAELYRTMQPLMELAGYRVFCLDLRCPAESPHRYNPLYEAFAAWSAGDTDEANIIIRSLASAIFTDKEGSQSDPFWHMVARSYFTGLAMSMLQSHCTPDEFTIESVSTINALLNGGPNKRKMVREFFDKCGGVAKTEATATINAPDDTRASIMSVFGSPISLFTSQDALMNLMSSSSFRAKDLLNPRTAIFIITPDEKGYIAPLAQAIMDQLFSQLMTIASKNPSGKLPHPIYALLDEFGNISTPLSCFGDVISAGRSRNIFMNVVLQSESQLQHVYGNELAQTISNNIYNRIFLGTRDATYLERFSKGLGVYKAPSGRVKPVMTPLELQQLECRATESEAVIQTSNLRPFVATLPDISCINLPTELAQQPQSTFPKKKRPVFSVERHMLSEQTLPKSDTPQTLDSLLKPNPRTKKDIESRIGVIDSAIEEIISSKAD